MDLCLWSCLCLLSLFFTFLKQHLYSQTTNRAINSDIDFAPLDLHTQSLSDRLARHCLCHPLTNPIFSFHKVQTSLTTFKLFSNDLSWRSYHQWLHPCIKFFLTSVATDEHHRRPLAFFLPPLLQWQHKCRQSSSGAESEKTEYVCLLFHLGSALSSQKWTAIVLHPCLHRE